MPTPTIKLPTDPAERKKLQLWTFLMSYFPRAFLEVAKVARIGNEQHNPGEPMHWSREKSSDQMNAAFNHIFEYGCGHARDIDGAHHLAKAIWRLSAQLQLDLEAEAQRYDEPPRIVPVNRESDLNSFGELADGFRRVTEAARDRLHKGKFDDEWSATLERVSRVREIPLGSGKAPVKPVMPGFKKIADKKPVQVYRTKFPDELPPFDKPTQLDMFEEALLDAKQQVKEPLTTEELLTFSQNSYAMAVEDMEEEIKQYEAAYRPITKR